MEKPKKKYLLGVDGGNSKTDYFLSDTNGEFVDILRLGTCSHEAFKNGFDGMQDAMASHLDILFTRNNTCVHDIEVAVFGLAGADLPSQIIELENRIKSIGFKKIRVSNDSLLGVKAISENGFGVCAICGTGSVVIGVNEKNQMLQIGGTGQIVGDLSGGSYLMMQCVSSVYNHYFRLGDYSSMIPRILKVLNVNNLNDYQEIIANNNFLFEKMTEILMILDDEAQNGDKIAKKILDCAAINSAEGVCGCIRNLNFSDDITIVQAGSIFAKIKYEGLSNNFKKIITQNINNKCNFITLKSSPSIGGIFWAKEIYDGKQIDSAYRNKMLSFLTNENYEKLVGKS